METRPGASRLAWKNLPRLASIGAFAVFLTACVTTSTQPDADDAQQAQAQATGPCSDLAPRELERRALELLDQGDTQEARAQLECALELKPGSPLATELIGQLDADPVDYLGAAGYAYVVKENETLSMIARDRLGSSLKFVILARYNDIEVPANLAAGATIRIPGDRPAESPAATDAGDEIGAPVTAADTAPPADTATGETPADLAEAALARESEGDLRGAYRLLAQAAAADPADPVIADDLARVRGTLLGQLEERAYAQELAGDFEQAIGTWDEVLAIDPANIPAQLSSQRLKSQLAPTP